MTLTENNTKINSGYNVESDSFAFWCASDFIDIDTICFSIMYNKITILK